MNFTSKQYTIMIVVSIISLFASAGYIEYLKNRPVVVPKDMVTEIVKEIYESDSVIVKPVTIQYNYKPAVFESTTNVSYWYVIVQEIMNDGGRVTFYNVYKFDHPYFDFDGIWNGELQHKNKSDYYVEYFTQISEASYKTFNNLLERVQ